MAGLTPGVLLSAPAPGAPDVATGPVLSGTAVAGRFALAAELERSAAADAAASGSGLGLGSGLELGKGSGLALRPRPEPSSGLSSGLCSGLGLGSELGSGLGSELGSGLGSGLALGEGSTGLELGLGDGLQQGKTPARQAVAASATAYEQGMWQCSVHKHTSSPTSQGVTTGIICGRAVLHRWLQALSLLKALNCHSMRQH